MLFTTISQLKDVLEATLHLSRDALHVHIGLLIFLAVAAALRGRWRFLIAFGVLLSLCLVGEMADFSYALRRNVDHSWLASIKDVANTMFWPAVGLWVGPHVLRMLRQRYPLQTVFRSQDPETARRP
jgi:hypothetical protein